MKDVYYVFKLRRIMNTYAIQKFREFIKRKHLSLVIYSGENELVMDGIRVMPLVAAMKFLGY